VHSYGSEERKAANVLDRRTKLHTIKSRALYQLS
jgi:hypothetical protein